MTDRLIHRRLKRAVGQIAGAGFFKAAADLGLVISGPLGNLSCGRSAQRRHSRRADQIQQTSACACTTLGETPAGIGNGVMDPRLLDDMFIEEIAAGGHQGDGTSALRPRCGELAAWAAVPVNRHTA